MMQIEAEPDGFFRFVRGLSKTICIASWWIFLASIAWVGIQRAFQDDSKELINIKIGNEN